MAAGTATGGTLVPFARLVRRTGRLSLPLTVALLLLLLSRQVALLPAAVAWLAGAALCAVLAYAREQKLVAVRRHLDRLLGDQAAATQFDLWGGDEIPQVLDRLERAVVDLQARQNERDQLLVSLLDSLPDPLLVIDRDRRIEQANQAAGQLFGRGLARRPLERILRDPPLIAAVGEALRGRGGGQSSIQAQINLQLPGPPERAFGVRVVPIQLQGQPAALLSMRELTEQVMIERMRSDFVANASHELRTPLTVLRGFIETLAGPARDDAAARERFLKTMGAEAARMSRLVDDLLSLSRIEQNEHVRPEGKVDLGACLDGVLAALEPYAEAAGTRLELKRPDDLPAVVGDRDQLAQLITNVVDNAIRYGGEAKPVTITARAVAKAPPGAGPVTGQPAVEIQVIDRGPGIAREHLPRLTERFFRVDPALSRKLGGTGLGLAIVKHILRRHRGHIAFASELGKGTTVTITLPSQATGQPLS
jgi:two-component system phosphate regulon sensor histidine kinase PhoR